MRTITTMSFLAHGERTNHCKRRLGADALCVELPVVILFARTQRCMHITHEKSAKTERSSSHVGFGEKNDFRGEPEKLSFGVFCFFRRDETKY